MGVELSNDLRFHEFEFVSDDFIGGEDEELVALYFSYLGLICELGADDLVPSVSELVCGLDSSVAPAMDDLAEDI